MSCPDDLSDVTEERHCPHGCVHLRPIRSHGPDALVQDIKGLMGCTHQKAMEREGKGHLE
jgi:hypothetical protein